MNNAKLKAFALRAYTAILALIAVVCLFTARTLLASSPEEVGVTLVGNRTVGAMAGMLFVIGLWAGIMLSTAAWRWSWNKLRHRPMTWGVALGVQDTPGNVGP